MYNHCHLFKAESLLALAQGSALCKLNSLKSSTVGARAFALSGLIYLQIETHRATPYAIACTLSGFYKSVKVEISNQ